MNKRLIITFGTILLLFTGTIVAIRYAQGYRFGGRQNIVKSTGLLSANSFPTGGSVYVNGNLTTATDSTLNLAPGEYEIEIRKEGYFPWKKKMRLDPELVTQTNALLLPTAPSLTPLTFTGAQAVEPSPDGQHILFVAASASAERNNGLYTLDLTDNPLQFQRGPRQIARSTSSVDLTQANYLWSPNSDQILVLSGNHSYLLDPTRLTDLDTARDVTVSLNETFDTWKQIMDQRMTTGLSKFPKEIQMIASSSATDVYFSPDQTKILYTATSDVALPDQLIPSVPASNTQPQARKLQAGNTYVYDLKEDRNFLVRSGQVPPVPTPTPGKAKTAKTQVALAKTPTILDTIMTFKKIYSGVYTGSPQWLPDSMHVFYFQDNAIRIEEYDGTNATPVYSGPLSDHFIFPWPNGSRLLFLTNFNQGGDVPINLYGLSLR